MTTSYRLSLALHGGSGTLTAASISPAQAEAYCSALRDALQIGWSILSGGGSALDASEATVVSLEDCPLFNAGCGSVYHQAGGHELDAAIMCGQSRRAGAVAGVQTVANPVKLVRRVMEDGKCVMVAGKGAEAYARDLGFPAVDASFFANEERFRQLKAAQGRDQVVMDHDGEAPPDEKFGTVGAVACDAQGNLAAATSTGGLTNKRLGRVGDTPVIGAGTYADNATCAVSCTGYGEAFLRSVVAHDVAARMRYGKVSLSEAADAVIHGPLAKMGGQGGLVAVDAQGNLTLPFNTEGMYRAWQQSNGAPEVRIFRDS